MFCLGALEPETSLGSWLINNEVCSDSITFFLSLVSLITNFSSKNLGFSLLVSVVGLMIESIFFTTHA